MVRPSRWRSGPATSCCSPPLRPRCCSQSAQDPRSSPSTTTGRAGADLGLNHTDTGGDEVTGSRPPLEPPPRGRVRAPSVVIVNAGGGKGKSTAAFGTAMRAIARGWRVCVVQFMQCGRWKVGAERSARSPGVEWWTIGDGFSWDSKDMDRTEAVARDAWRTARDKRQEPAYGLVILDEATHP